MAAMDVDRKKKQKGKKKREAKKSEGIKWTQDKEEKGMAVTDSEGQQLATRSLSTGHGETGTQTGHPSPLSCIKLGEAAQK